MSKRKYKLGECVYSSYYDESMKITKILTVYLLDDSTKLHKETDIEKMTGYIDRSAG